MKKINLLSILILIFICILSIPTNSKATNQERFFLRLSDKYDEELNKEWEYNIIERERIISEIKKNNQYDKYKDFLNKQKKTKEFRVKNKYIRKLNYSIKVNDVEKIKRYLKLISNIFYEENTKIKEYFNIN